MARGLKIVSDVRKLIVARGRNRTADMRILSPVVVPGLFVTIGRYVYLFKRLTAVSAGRFYRFEHIVSYSSGKVIAKWQRKIWESDDLGTHLPYNMLLNRSPKSSGSAMVKSRRP